MVVVGESLREDDPAVAARREAVSSGVRGRGGQGVVRWHVCLECRERPCGGSERTVKFPLASDDVVVVVVIARPRGIYSSRPKGQLLCGDGGNGSVKCVTRAGFAVPMATNLVSHGEGAQGVEGRRRFFGILFLPPEGRRSFFEAS